MSIESTKFPFLVTGEQLHNLPTVQQDWLLDGVLAYNVRRLSLLAGKPEDGKSTLSMQLGVAVTKGVPFLGRNTKRTGWLHWQHEENKDKLKLCLARLGYDHKKDAPFYAFVGTAGQSTFSNLRSVLDEHKNIGLVTLETLDDIFRLEDGNNNSEARRKFQDFDSQILLKFSHRCVFLGLSQLIKRERQNTGDMILGASALRARTDAKLYIRCISDSDQRRVFWTKTRGGRDIPRTILNFDPVTGTSTLGLTESEDRKQNVTLTKERIKEDIVTFVANHPACSEDDIVTFVNGRTEAKWKALKELVRIGVIARNGKGTKGSPYTYDYVDIPVEGKAA